MNRPLIVVAITFALLTCCSLIAAETIVDVNGLGKLRGTVMASSSGQRILAFRGIPYAQPPVEELRFADPVPFGPWKNVKDAVRDGPCCMQTPSDRCPVFVESEDCLYLNVYTKMGLTNLPVMVFIHGGAWTRGCGESLSYGPQYLLDENVVLVTINYRLGVFGFLSTEDAAAPGNYGLLDQNLALKWVRDHISSFGGDPKVVTIFGESAGGYSVSHHTLSPLSAGLFHRAISQSGTSRCPRAIIEGNFESLKRQADLLGYSVPPTDTTQVLNFLRSQPAQSLVDTQSRLSVFMNTPIIYGPRVDKERDAPFLPEDPRLILRSGNYAKVPLISGVNKDEGALLCAGLLASNQSNLDALVSGYRDVLPPLLEFHKSSDPRHVAEIIWNYYITSSSNSEPIYTKLTEMLGDRLYYHGLIDDVKLRLGSLSESTSSQIYLYLLTERPTLNLVDMIYGIPRDLGVSHADDLLFLFPSPRNGLIHYRLGSRDHFMSRLMVTLFTSFARSGVPVLLIDTNTTWLPTTKDHRRYLDLNVHPKLISESFPFEGRLGIWNDLNLN